MPDVAPPADRAPFFRTLPVFTGRTVQGPACPASVAVDVVRRAHERGGGGRRSTGPTRRAVGNPHRSRGRRQDSALGARGRGVVIGVYGRRGIRTVGRC